MFTEMTFQIKGVNFVFHTFLFSLLTISIQGTDTDIYCLKSIKNSLEDPNGYLSSSWNFDNNTEGHICRFNGVDCWHPDENRVLNLKLSNMGLKGQFPRGLVNCSSMTGLDLSFNNISGPIPSDISAILNYVTSIDLSNNKFTGEIPIALANCTYLNSLRLDNNMLSGEIPQRLGLLSRLKSISVAYNQLSGPVPVFAENVELNYANNSGLCGGSLGPCSSDDDNPNEFHQSFKSGLMVGLALSLTCSVMVMSYSRIQLKKKRDSHINKVKELIIKCICSIIRRRPGRVASGLQHLMQVEKGSKEISVLLERVTSTVWFEELCEATNCFSMDNVIGFGKMGMMYEGSLPNGELQAIKRLMDSQLFKRHFLSEIVILGKYKHQNIVSLLGFCIEGKEMLLAYTYMSNGRLSKWLHPLESEILRLKWHVRVNIALGIARGLSWLHHSCDLQIVHHNICSKCILLDDNFEPKISNFGEAKFMNINNIEGGLGMIFGVNDGKKDVYDFGSILFELITGKTYNELSCSSSTSDLYGNPSNFYNTIDKSLIGEGFENEVFTLLNIACECVQLLSDQRPTMLEVYNNIIHVRKGRHGSSDDFISHTPKESEITSAISTSKIFEL